MSTHELHHLTEHVYWFTPSTPDRPSLAAIAGKDATLWLDAGASAAHVAAFRAALTAENVADPKYVALTHWHWDHVFGAAHIDATLIAHRATAEHLERLNRYKWDDAALDERLRTGVEIEMCARDIKLELPEPRTVHIAQPSMIFADTLELQLGDVTCHIQHVGGDHAADSCVMYLLPDRVLFLGDCLYDAIYAPKRHMTTANLFPLLDKVLAYDAEYFIEGHMPTVESRAELEDMANKMRVAGQVVDAIGTDEAAVFAEIQARTGSEPDEDTVDFARSFIAGRELAQQQTS